MDLSIIIVNFNTSPLLLKCLESVYKSIYYGNLQQKSEIIVVDNASIDESVTNVKKKYSQIKLICNKKNFGYAKANNQGIKASKGKYILLLNSDTILKKTSLNNILKVISSDNKIGIVGCKLLYTDNKIQYSCGFFPYLHKVLFWMLFLDDLPIIATIFKSYHTDQELFYHKDHEVDWVSGAFFLISKESLEKTGLLDENIFMYGEEMELCYRVKNKGFKVYYTATAEIYHLKGASSETLSAGITEEFSALIYFYKKHRSNIELFLLRKILIFGALLRIGLFGIIGRYPERLSLYVKAIKLVR